MELHNIQERNVRDYLILASLNPELPTIPMVESEVVAGDDCERWSGVIGRARVREYTFEQMYADGEQYVFKDDTEKFRCYLEDCCEMNEEEIEDRISKIQWQKAIFLDIDI
jgi:hypothetical protein